MVVNKLRLAACTRLHHRVSIVLLSTHLSSNYLPPWVAVVMAEAGLAPTHETC